MKCYPFASVFLIFISSFLCTKDNSSITLTNDYYILNNKIYYKNNPIQLFGTNAMHVFSAGGSDMKSWQFDIIREFVGNIKETPLTGYPIKDENNSYLYSLQTIVDSNRKNNKITILCAFGWDGTTNNLFTGKMPKQCFWWNDYKLKLQQWAIQFKNQSDVWLEVWNEPYRYDRADGYTDNIWQNDMNEMVATIRDAGNNNIVVVPCAEQGQDESVLINQANTFLINKTNILFDIHAYEKWLLVNNDNVIYRLQQLQNTNIDQ